MFLYFLCWNQFHNRVFYGKWNKEWKYRVLEYISSINRDNNIDDHVIVLCMLLFHRFAYKHFIGLTNIIFS